MSHDNTTPVLYSYWRSSSSWRVRIVLNLKGINYDYHAINLLNADQLSDDYTKINPLKEIPTLVIDGHTLCQSVAIMEYLEETRPEPSLFPKDPYVKSKVRQIVETVTGDIQPIQNLRVLKKVGEDKKMEWGKYWIEQGFIGLEQILSTTAGKYSVGDEVTLADCVLVPQVYNATRFAVDMKLFPTISRVNEELSKLEAFKKAHPDNQPDAPKTN